MGSTGSARSLPFRLPRALIAGGLLCLVSLVAARPVLAAECGDRVRGSRVACACGDVVVTDTTLRPGDPVVSGRCSLDGLILRAAALSESLTLDMAGLAIIGNGEGIGLRVDGGGNDGARIVSGVEARGEIVGFGTGVMSPSLAGLARIENIAVKGSRRDGLRLRASGVLLIDVSTTDNGGDGIELSGQGGRLVDVDASGNRQVGMRVRTRGTVVGGRAVANGKHGIISDGARNDVSGAVARDNGGVGVIVRGARQKTAGVVTEGNALGGLRATGSEIE